MDEIWPIASEIGHIDRRELASQGLVAVVGRAIQLGPGWRRLG